MMQNHISHDGSRRSSIDSLDESSGYSSQSLGSSTAPLPRSSRQSKLSAKVLEELFEFDEVFDNNDDEEGKFVSG